MASGTRPHHPRVRSEASSKTVNINGHFSYIGKEGKFIFTWIDSTSKEILYDACKSASSKPFDAEGFKVIIPPHIRKNMPADLTAMVGLNCCVSVVVIHYDFVSSLAVSRGQRITGHKLMLENIVPRRY